MRSSCTTISCVAAAVLAAVLHAGDAHSQGGTFAFPLGPQWTSTLAAPIVFDPGYDAEHAYVSLRNGHLVAVALTDGRTSWDIELRATAAPVASEGLVFVSSNGQLEARAGEDGRERWRLPLDDHVTALHVQAGWIFAGSDRGELLAVRAAEGPIGKIAWRQSLNSQVAAPPAIAGDRVYVPLEDGRVLALALATGEPLWTARLEGRAGSLVALDDRIFVGSDDNHLYSLSAKDGDIRWAWRTGGDLLGAPVVDRDHVYFVSLDNLLRALDRGNGSLQWHRPLPMRPSSGPLLVNDLLIVAGVAAELRAFAAPTGAPSGEFPTGAARDEAQQLAAAPHLTPGPAPLLIIATRDGRLTALKPEPAPAPKPDPAATPAPEVSPTPAPPRPASEDEEDP